MLLPRLLISEKRMSPAAAPLGVATLGVMDLATVAPAPRLLLRVDGLPQEVALLRLRLLGAGPLGAVRPKIRLLLLGHFRFPFDVITTVVLNDVHTVLRSSRRYVNGWGLPLWKDCRQDYSRHRESHGGDTLGLSHFYDTRQRDQALVTSLSRTEGDRA